MNAAQINPHRDICYNIPLKHEKGVQLKALVTGAAGAIESNLTKKLLEDPAFEHVTVLDDLSSGFKDNLPEDAKLTFVHGSVTEDDALEQTSDFILKST